MKFKITVPKGESNTYYILIGAALAVLIIFGIGYYNDHHNDVVIHPPQVDVH
jgi:hypothetical protein